LDLRGLLLREGRAGRTGWKGRGRGKQRVGEKGEEGRGELYRHFFPPFRALVALRA